MINNHLIGLNIYCVMALLKVKDHLLLYRIGALVLSLRIVFIVVFQFLARPVKYALLTTCVADVVIACCIVIRRSKTASYVYISIA